MQHFYPRPPRGGRHAKMERKNRRNSISIHALREEGDRVVLFITLIAPKFLSTPSARRATIHKLHAHRRARNFYPRPPRGGRLVRKASFDPQFAFLSTPSARRATLLRVLRNSVVQHFYPRPPRGGRLIFCLQPIILWLFLSTPSARRATPRTPDVMRECHISIHALREEGDERTAATLPPFQ